jgi:hypothetical protein
LTAQSKLRHGTFVANFTSVTFTDVFSFRFFFFQALNFLVESFGLLNDLFPFPSILDAGYPVFYLQLSDIPCDVILPSVLGFSL